MNNLLKISNMDMRTALFQIKSLILSSNDDNIKEKLGEILKLINKTLFFANEEDDG